jgi:glycine cleavage system protein P-like pyridoxal-binding family
MSSEERGRSSYLDLLITTLMEHEKNLDAIVEKMEKITEELKTIRSEPSSKPEKTVDVKVSAIKEKAKKGSSESEPDSLVYMKIKLDRSIDDLIKIIEALKE